ncbi:MAG: FGGY-family carbohydrate kinase [Planctomycetota bacterium]
MSQYLLGIDNGGTVAKAAVFSIEGEEIAVASSKTETISPKPGWAEFDMHALWQATAASVRQVIARSAVGAEEIVAVAATGHGNGIYLVDDDGRPVRRGIFSTDTRARPYVDRWTADGVGRAVRPKTMQALWPGQPNALWAWLWDHEPEAVRRARWVLMCKDFIRLRLTGETCGELTDMSGTSLVNVATGRYDPEILACFGIPEIQRRLPPLQASADVCGHVTDEAAALTGLAEGTPVAGGLFDIDACGLSSALTEESRLGMVFGTWGINQYVSQTPVADESVFMTSRYCIPGYYLMLEASPTSAGNLEWFVDQLVRPETAVGEGHGGVYDRVNELISETSPDEAGLVYLPFLYGSNVGPDASAALVGMRDRHHRGHVLRAVHEGVVFAHKMHLERLLKVRDVPERIRASGGAARSDAWMQIVADVFQVPVDVPDGSELGALGAAMCAAVAVGCHESYQAACDRMVRFSRTFEPNPSLGEIYQSKYARYSRLLEAMGPAWNDLA